MVLSLAGLIPTNPNPKTNMKTEITVYDGNPALSGPCSWPDTFSGVADSSGISKSARTRILRVARKCGEYSSGNRLWLIARDQSGTEICSDTVVV